MNEQKFLALYQRQQESGLTIKEFCSNEAIAPATFHYWKKKLGGKNRLPGFIPVVVNTSVKLFAWNFRLGQRYFHGRSRLNVYVRFHSNIKFSTDFLFAEL